MNCLTKPFEVEVFDRTRLINFNLLKTCWKSPKLHRRILAHFEKMSLARWFWAFFEKSFLARKMGQNERFFVFSFSSIRKMKANKKYHVFSNLSNSRFRSLIGWIQTHFLKNERKFFYILFFTKFLSTWNWTIWRKKRGDRS